MNKKPNWDKKWGKYNNICPITLTRMRPGKNKNGINYVISLECGHRFWRKALQIWKEENKSCPICRKEIKILNK